jgi:hypothetical protein
MQLAQALLQQTRLVERIYLTDSHLPFALGSARNCAASPESSTTYLCLPQAAV